MRLAFENDRNVFLITWTIIIYILKKNIFGDFLISFICGHFQTIARTKDNIVKKQALTYEEIEAEREEVRNSSFTN